MMNKRFTVFWFLSIIALPAMAVERDFYLPSQPAQPPEQIQIRPYSDRDPAQVADYQVVYTQWVTGIGQYEQVLALQPDVTGAKRAVDRAGIIMAWHRDRSSELLYLAQGFQWLKDSGELISQQSMAPLSLPAELKWTVERWAQGAHNGLQTAVHTMMHRPREHAALTLVLARSLDSDRYASERERAQREINKQMNELRTRVKIAKGYLQNRSRALRSSIELEDNRQ
ncbi:MAG: hypothetical protein JAZ15_03140 [Candidatus Thiodiazotropha endolucinida]|nr:hypothetical protein [Candidatus Thiodiazotropha taylori]MCW4311989.1 hypothetical protein [Candidatus Thiodiazotropha taylori]